MMLSKQSMRKTYKLALLSSVYTLRDTGATGHTTLDKSFAIDNRNRAY